MREVNIKYMVPFGGESDARVDHDGDDRYWEWVLRGQGTCHGYRGRRTARGRALTRVVLQVVFSAMRTEVHTIVHNGPHTSTLDGRTIHDGYCATFSKKIVRGMQKNIGVIFLKQNNDRAADDTDDGY